MATAAPVDFVAVMRPVAIRLLGEPNRHLSRDKDLRWGNKGSVSVDLEKGAFFDNEANAGGGVIDLVMREQRCDQRGAIDWLRREGFLEEQASNDRASSASTFYDYTDAAGATVYRVERRGKSASPPFLQHGPDGAGGFHSTKGCMNGVIRVPYRLQDLVAARFDQIVFVTEGEKDADRLASLGLVATTNSGGAGKFGPVLVPHFVGRRVAVLPDNDDAGRRHGDDVVGKLKNVAAAIAVVPLPGLPEKGDVSDWLDRGGSPARLIEIAQAALRACADLLPICDLSSWADQDPTPKSFAMAGYIPERELTLASGVGGANKSLFGQQLATCFASNREMLGIALTGGVAMYVTAEDDERELHWRQAHICKAVGVDMASLAGRLILTSLRGQLENELATFVDMRLVLTAAFARLGRSIAATGAKLVILDNVAHLFAGNENDRVHVTAFVNALYALCNEHGCAIVLVAHPNKAGDDYSGSTAWLNAVRSHIVIRRPENALDPDQRELITTKANYAKIGERLEFRWHDFALIRDGDLPAERMAEIAAVAQGNADDEIFLRCLDLRNRQERPVSESKASRTYAPKEFTDMPESRRIGRRRLEAAMERMFRTGTIERGFIYRDAGEGKDRHGLRRTSADLSADVPPTSPPTSPLSAADHPLTTADTHPLSKDIRGAALGAAAPLVNEERKSTRKPTTGMILAPGESGDDAPIAGWNR